MTVEPKVFDHIKKILASFDGKYMNGDVLKRNAIIDDLDKYDENLLEALLSDKLIHDTYTKKIAGVEVFETNQFISMLEFKDYWEDSYTKYTNKIGLTAGGKFIDESEDVVLDFPYKDCVLKAGMTKEDAKDSDEPFLNEIIAKPEIDELLEPKVFVHAKRYDADGEHEADSFTDTDNLIIKGNNLIALYSLKERYAGKVKMIYLDVPFNTENDFPYNDKFSHSTWLTFIKNRIDIAKELLSDDGILFFHADDNEIFYAKILLDNILGRDKFINSISVKLAEASGVKMSNVNKRFLKSKDTILLYKKTNFPIKFNPIKISKEKWDPEYNKIFVNLSNDDFKTISKILSKEEGSTEDIATLDRLLRNVSISSVSAEYKKSNSKLSLDDWRKENAYRIFRTAASSSVKKLADEKKKRMESNVIKLRH